MSNHNKNDVTTINPIPAIMSLMVFILPIFVLVFMLRSGAVIILGVLFAIVGISILAEMLSGEEA